jgi:hypothetical protein
MTRAYGSLYKVGHILEEEWWTRRTDHLPLYSIIGCRFSFCELSHEAKEIKNSETSEFYPGLSLYSQNVPSQGLLPDRFWYILQANRA